MKDYYAILGVTPVSTQREIKIRYRTLVKQFHPDIMGNDAYASAQFHDIKEAYETLTHPSRKEEWLKERWLRQAHHAGKGDVQPLTPFSILEKVLKLEREVAGMDVFRMDHTAVAFRVENLLSTENQECLRKFNEPDMTQTIIRHLLMTLRPIPVHLAKTSLDRMAKLAEDHMDMKSEIIRFRASQRKASLRNQFTLPLVLVATALICLLIYLAGRQ